MDKTFTVEDPDYEAAFARRFEEFLAWLGSREALLTMREGSSFPPPAFRFTVGKKYVRIVRGTSAYCFIDFETGQIWKPASYAAPALNFPRSSLFNEVSDWERRIHRFGL